MANALKTNGLLSRFRPLVYVIFKTGMASFQPWEFLLHVSCFTLWLIFRAVKLFNYLLALQAKLINADFA